MEKGVEAPLALIPVVEDKDDEAISGREGEVLAERGCGNM